MKFAITQSKAQLMCAAYIVFSSSIVHAETRPTRQIPSGEKAQVTGTIVSRHEMWLWSGRRSPGTWFLSIYLRIRRSKG